MQKKADNHEEHEEREEKRTSARFAYTRTRKPGSEHDRSGDDFFLLVFLRVLRALRGSCF